MQSVKVFERLLTPWYNDFFKIVWRKFRESSDPSLKMIDRKPNPSYYSEVMTQFDENIEMRFASGYGINHV